MASIVDSLFGPQPWQIEQQQRQNLDTAADKYASQSPFQRASGQLYRAGGMLGGAAMEGMGYENPAIAQAKQQEAAMQGADLQTPEGLRALAQRLNSMGMQKQAYAAATAANQLDAAKQEMATKRAAELASLKKTESEASPLAKIPFEKATAESRKRYMITKNIGDLEFADPEDKISQWAIQLKGAGLEPGTPEFKAEMKKRWDAEVVGSSKKGTSITNVMPGQEKAIDVPNLRNKIRQSIKPETEQIGFADTALAELELAIKTDNPIAYQTARTNLARAAGGGNISREEIKAAGGDPSLFGQIGDKTSVWFTGTPMLETQQKMRATVRAVRRVAAKKARNELDAQAALLHRAGYSAEDIDALLRMKDIDKAESTPEQINTGAAMPSKTDADLIRKHLKRKNG